MVGGHGLTWETLGQERSFACEAFEVFTDRVRLPDGMETRFDYVREPPSAVVLPFTRDGEVVVLREYRHAVGRVALGLPGGSAEPEDEAMRETAARELLEETGYRAASMRPLLAAEPANGVLDSTRHYFTATGCTPAVDAAPDVDESIRVETMDHDELLERVLAGGVRDERTVTAVLLHRVLDAGEASADDDG